MSQENIILSVNRLKVEFETRQGIVTVIDNLDFNLAGGETLGIVGESGCGKSMTALAILRLIPSPPGRISAGHVYLSGEDLLCADQRRIREIRGREISMIFQEPMTSLNPVFSVGSQIAETIVRHEQISRKAALQRSIDLLHSVGIPAPEKRVKDYPYQLSGGMRQRVMIAMAIACNPKILIADEPTTALDVTVQAQFLDLIKNIQDRTGTAIIYITHDMGVIAEVAKKVMVMYAGRKVEEGPAKEILCNAGHPYTRALIACVPRMERNPPAIRPPLLEISGIVPSLSTIGDACPFAPRCIEAEKECYEKMPPYSYRPNEQMVACWRMLRK